MFSSSLRKSHKWHNVWQPFQNKHYCNNHLIICNINNPDQHLYVNHCTWISRRTQHTNYWLTDSRNRKSVPMKTSDDQIGGWNIEQQKLKTITFGRVAFIINNLTQTWYEPLYGELVHKRTNDTHACTMSSMTGSQNNWYFNPQQIWCSKLCCCRTSSMEQFAY